MIVILTILYGIKNQFKVKTLTIPYIKTNLSGKISNPKEIIYLQLLLFLLVALPLIDQSVYLKGILLGLLYLVPSYILAILITFVSNNFRTLTSYEAG